MRTLNTRARQLAYLTIISLVLAAPALAGKAHDTIKGPLNSGPEVTQVCLECHDDAATQVMKTSHWTWSAKQTIDGKEIDRGKRNTINNFCVSINANWPRCTSCHIGYGWKDQNFDFSDQTMVDCLGCHDTTGTYKKIPTGAGAPAESIDLLYIARNVGPPVRQNCGTCHFFGGGGDAVKHGDLDSSMDYPEKEIDVHMNVEGPDFSCQTCHKTEDHYITGNAMVVSPASETPIGCNNCHEGALHEETLIDQHLDSVACQTCHIPYFAKETPTKLYWDWSTAGQDIKGEKDEYGKPTFMKKKGHFKWGKMVVPDYAWYSYKAGVYLAGDKIDPDKVTLLSYPIGERSDAKAKIFPFKSHGGKQIYDKKHNYLITPKVFGKGGFWKTFDWDKAAKAGMEITGLPYSGEYGFAETKMYWRINHMVSPKAEALGCIDCHGDQGRMDWKKLGYEGDPLRNTKFARTK
jgi:octaheme c-type cytochrome (tetrathionate reductase family)